MNKKLTLKDSINLGKKQKIKISEIVEIKGEIFKYVKQGYNFDDEVLEKAHIKKTISNTKTIGNRVSSVKQKEKPLPKETENIKNILKTINTLDEPNNNEDVFNQVDDTYTLIEEEEE